LNFLSHPALFIANEQVGSGRHVTFDSVPKGKYSTLLLIAVTDASAVNYLINLEKSKLLTADLR